MANNLQNDINLLFEMGCLRFIDRNWKQFFGADFANLSEHHLRVIWIALIIAKYEKVKNIEKILKMALVHDIVESRTGDLDKMQRKYVQRDEDKAIKDIFNDSIMGDELIKLWQEYEQCESKEARIVKDADILDIDFEMKEQEIKGYKFSPKWARYRQSLYNKKLYSKTAKQIWKNLQKADPHAWHIKGGSV